MRVERTCVTKKHTKGDAALLLDELAVLLQYFHLFELLVCRFSQSLVCFEETSGNAELRHRSQPSSESSEFPCQLNKRLLYKIDSPSQIPP